MSGGRDTHDPLKADFGYSGGYVAKQSVTITLRVSVHNVIALIQLSQELSNLFRRVLKIVIHGDNYFVAGLPNTAQQSVALAVVPQERKNTNPRVSLFCRVHRG